MNKLAKIRKQAGISQCELSRRSKVDRSLISDIERGAADNITTKTLTKLAAALGCEPRDLM